MKKIENQSRFRLQNSPYFCVFKYATSEQSNKRSRTRLKTESETDLIDFEEKTDCFAV